MGKIKFSFTRFIILLGFIASLLVSCSKEEYIVQLPVGLFTFTTFTQDTFRFKVEVNDALVTDSLLSPTFSLTSRINLPDSMTKLKVTDLKNEILLEIREYVNNKNSGILVGDCKISVVELMKNFGIDKWFLLDLNRDFAGEVHIISKFQL